MVLQIQALFFLLGLVLLCNSLLFLQPSRWLELQLGKVIDLCGQVLVTTLFPLCFILLLPFALFFFFPLPFLCMLFATTLAFISQEQLCVSIIHCALLVFLAHSQVTNEKGKAASLSRYFLRVYLLSFFRFFSFCCSELTIFVTFFLSPCFI